MAKVVALNISEKKGVPKRTIEKGEFIEKWKCYISNLPSTKLETFIVGLVSLLIIILWPKTNKKISGDIKQGQSLINILAIISVIALAIAGTLSAGIFVKLVGIAFLGSPRSEHAKVAKEVPFTMLLPKGVLALLCLLIGIFPIPIIGLITTTFKKINVIEISGSGSGNSMIPWFLVKINNNGIIPAFSLGLGLLIITLLLVFIKIFLGKTSSRKYNTWDCGFESLNSRMQYSAAGFSNPISIILRSFFKPIEKLIIKRGLTPHHSRRIEYHLVIENIFEKRLYSPFIRFSTRLSRKIKFKIQTGSIHLYLVYIFIAIFI